MARRTRQLVPRKGRPLHVQLAELLAGEIAAGRYGLGDHMPGARRLAEEYEVADLVARKAIDLLASARLLSKGPTTQAPEVIVGPEAARQLMAELAALNVKSDTERIDDLETRMALQENHIRALYSKLGERYPEQRLRPAESSGSL